MVLWTSKLYCGDKLQKKKDKLVTSINNSEVTFGIYCIAFASHPDNLFDILDANELLYPHYRKKQTCIVGLAKGKTEALEMVQSMVMEVYKKTGSFNVRTYFT